MKNIKTLDAKETLARFILTRRHFRTTGRVMAEAFMPPADLKLSVFRVKGLKEKMVWNIGKNHVATPSKRTLYGRADVVVAQVRQSGLQVDPDDIPTHHANIIGWPGEKSAQKIIAKKLAAEATLKLIA